MTDTVVVIGPPLAGVSSVAAGLRHRLEGCAVVESDGLLRGQIPDAVVFVTSAAAPMRDSDAAVLAEAAGRTEAVVAAVTKIDVHRDWRTVLDINRTAVPATRYVPWVGVAADPQIGPVVIGPLADAIRTELDDEHRRRRNLLRAREWALQGRVAAWEREAERRAALRAHSARHAAARVRVQQARLYLAGEARARSAALRGDAQREAAAVSRRDLGSFEARVCGRAAQVVEEFDRAVAERMAEIDLGAAVPVRPLAPAPPVQSYLPSPRRAVLEDRLAAVFGTGFGCGVALTLGRFLVEALPAAMPTVVPLCGGAGAALAYWVIRTRRLVAARAALERWVAEVASAVRSALEDRALRAESALLEAHNLTQAVAGPDLGGTADPMVEAWLAELARVRAELGAGRRR